MKTAAGDWFRPIVGALFGSYDVSTNRRMIQELFLLVPKKNGKSSYAAAIMVVAMIMNRRPEAEFLLIAPTKMIADIAFKQARGIIKADPALDKLFHPQQHLRMITHLETGAVLQIKAADTDAITGSKSTGILIDETHEFSKKGKAEDIFIEVRGALAARPDGFLIQITTQSKEPPAGLFRAELKIARDIRDGLLQMPRLPILYELPLKMQEGDAWKNENLWHLVNPNLGLSVDIDFLRNALKEAESKGEEQLKLLASQHFNIEIGLRQRSDRWPGADFWEAAGYPRTEDGKATLTVTELIRRCEVIVVGIDGGGLDDLLGLTLLGREKKTGKWLSISMAWAHEIAKTRRKDIISRLNDFEKEGSLTWVKTPGQDVEQVVKIIMRIEDAGLLAEKDAVGVDQAGIGDIYNALIDEENGLEPTRIVGISQGWKLNGAIKTTERRVAGGELEHDGSALMDWCVGNAKCEPRGNAVTITKQMSGTAKIDPLMSLFNAVHLMALNPESAGSAYEDEDVLV